MEQKQGFHFYASSVACWKTDTNVDALLAYMKKDRLPFTVWYVPLPSDAGYKISMYAPMAEGAFCLQFFDLDQKGKWVEVQKGNKLPPVTFREAD